MSFEKLKAHFQNVLSKMQTVDTSIEIDQAIRDEPPSFQERLRNEFLGIGPLEALLLDPEITEIVLSDCKPIWIERAGQFTCLDDGFLSPLTFENFCQRLAREAGLTPTLNVPFADGEWRSCRVHMATPPVTNSVQITIRTRPPSPWTLGRLEGLGWAPASALGILRDWLAQRKNLLVIGPTGSGKTSVLNALLQEIDPTERVICLEDTSELVVRGGSSCKLLTRSDVNGLLKEYTLTELVRQSLRMRPQRLVLGEVRGPEAKDLLLALATGHRGSLGTLHAADAKQALLRLEMLVQLGAGQWDREAIRQLIQLSIDGIAVCGIHEGIRRLEGLYRIASLESFGFLVETVWRARQTN